jgi:hypothetical protein
MKKEKKKKVGVSSKDKAINNEKKKFDEFVNHFNEKFPFKFELQDSANSATSRILKFIPQRELSCLYVLFRFAVCHEEVYKDLRIATPDPPIKEIIEIKNALEKLKKKNWLSSLGEEKIKTLINEQLMFSVCGADFICSSSLQKVFFTGGRIQENMHLGGFVSYLVESLKSITGKPNYGLIADFLVEQGTLDAITDDGIKKIYKRHMNSSQCNFYGKLELAEKILSFRKDLRNQLSSLNDFQKNSFEPLDFFDVD